MREGDLAEAIFELKKQLALLQTRGRQIGMIQGNEGYSHFDDIEALALSCAALARLVADEYRRR